MPRRPPPANQLAFVTVGDIEDGRKAQKELAKRNRVNEKARKVREAAAAEAAGKPKVLNLFDRVAGELSRLWREKYNAEYFLTGADRNHLGRLLQSLPPEAIPLVSFAFSRYLDDPSSYVMYVQRHSVCFFCTSGAFNKYRVKAPVVTDREARSMVAAKQFSERNKGK